MLSFIKKKKRETCPLCEKEYKKLNPKFRISDTFICTDCLILIKGVWKEQQEDLRNKTFVEVRNSYNIVLKARGVNNYGGLHNNDNCPICKMPIAKAAPSYVTLDGYRVCKEHYIEVTPTGLLTPTRYSLEEMKKNINDAKAKKIEIDNKIKEFVPTIDVRGRLFIDTNNMTFASDESLANGGIYPLELISGYEVSENDEVVTSGGLGRAAIGAVTFGGAGAVVGAITGKKSYNVVNNLKVKIFLDSVESPLLYINLLSSQKKKTDPLYLALVKIADEILSVLNSTLNKISTERQMNQSAFDSIKNYKELLDTGIITSEEFEIKKRELLDL